MVEIEKKNTVKNKKCNDKEKYKSEETEQRHDTPETLSCS